MTALHTKYNIKYKLGSIRALWIGMLDKLTLRTRALFFNPWNYAACAEDFF